MSAPNGHVPAFRFPTSVAVVDDNPDFLANIALQLDPQLAVRGHASAAEALAGIDAASRDSPLATPFFAPYAERDELAADRHVIAVSIDDIGGMVRDPNRFATVSVAVVDYDMPGIDGLEFCRRIGDPAIRTILLTGKADEKIAVQAFNEGLIDRFIRKQDPAAIPLLNAAIAELQRAFFDDAGRRLAEALAAGSHRYLRDPAFVAEFGRWSAEHGIVEHYLLRSPEGLLALDASGAAWRVIVMDERTLASHREITAELGAPAELRRELESGRVLPYFWASGGDYDPADPDWKRYLVPARSLLGSGGRLWIAVVPDPPGIDLGGVLSYRAFLDQLDAATRQPPGG